MLLKETTNMPVRAEEVPREVRDIDGFLKVVHLATRRSTTPHATPIRNANVIIHKVPYTVTVHDYNDTAISGAALTL